MTASMRVRRCAAVVVELREDAEVDLPALLTGGDAVRRRPLIQALAAHLDEPVALNPSEVEALAGLSSEQYCTARADDAEHAEVLQRLHAKRLALAEDDDDEASRRDRDLRAVHWHSLAAIAHRHSRWSGVRTTDNDPDSYARSLSALVSKLGPPPEAAPQRGDAASRTRLPGPIDTAVARALQRRATCRNFDRTHALPLDLASTVLHGVFGAQDAVRVPAGAEVLKKLSPSGGGLHPTEAYVLALDVEGLSPGIWHYRAKDHALDPLARIDADELRAFALNALAGQSWFADAPMMVVHACRFERSFWKYRQHTKAYRAVVLDIGHLSQTAYLLATELGLGAFVTAAINEADIERRLGLDPMAEGAMAISGFGYRGTEQMHPEFDPRGEIWDQEQPAQ